MTSTIKSQQEWNDGTVFRTHVRLVDVDGQSHYTVPIDIAQGELNGKVFMGIELINVFRDLNGTMAFDQATDQLTQTVALQKYHAVRDVYFFESFQLPPDVDFSATTGAGSNTQVFARVPVPFHYMNKVGSGETEGCYNHSTVGYWPLSKNGILYEMSNNPNALSNGRLQFRIVDYSGQPIKNVVQLAFTLVIYKPRNTYN